MVYLTYNFVALSITGGAGHVKPGNLADSRINYIHCQTARNRRPQAACLPLPPTGSSFSSPFSTSRLTEQCGHSGPYLPESISKQTNPTTDMATGQPDPDNPSIEAFSSGCLRRVEMMCVELMIRLVLRTQPGSSVEAVSALNQGAFETDHAPMCAFTRSRLPQESTQLKRRTAEHRGRTTTPSF